jgi:hypothetical protein
MMNPYCPKCFGLTDPEAQKWLNVPLCKCQVEGTTAGKNSEEWQPKPCPFDRTINMPVQWVGTALLLLLLSSCQFAQHESHASATKWEKDINITWGGTTHTTGADGWDNATDHNASFQVAAQTAGTTLTAYIGYLTTRITEITKQLQNANLTKQQIATLKYQYLTTKAQLDAATAQAQFAVPSS